MVPDVPKLPPNGLAEVLNGLLPNGLEVDALLVGEPNCGVANEKFVDFPSGVLPNPVFCPPFCNFSNIKAISCEGFLRASLLLFMS